MKKALPWIISVVGVIVITCAIVLPIALSTPKWYKDARTTFTNSSFAPEVQDILPSAILDDNSLESSEASGTNIQASLILSAADETLPVSELETFGYGRGDDVGFDTLLESVLKMHKNIQNLKSEVITELNKSKLTEKGVWQNGLKYEENENGDMFFYRVRENNVRGAKLSVYADGTTEAYRFGKNNSEIYSIEYSYFKDNKFIKKYYLLRV